MTRALGAPRGSSNRAPFGCRPRNRPSQQYVYSTRRSGHFLAYSAVTLVVRCNSIAGSIVGLKLPLEDLGYLGVVGAVVGICHGIQGLENGLRFCEKRFCGNKMVTKCKPTYMGNSGLVVTIWLPFGYLWAPLPGSG